MGGKLGGYDESYFGSHISRRASHIHISGWEMGCMDTISLLFVMKEYSSACLLPPPITRLIFM